MTFREMNLRVFQREPLPCVFFQPRFEPWFELHQRMGSLPPELQDKNVYDAYRALGVSMRYMHYSAGSPNPIEMRHIRPVETYSRKTNRGYFHVIKTPHGELATYYGATDQGCRIIDFPVKTPEDLLKLEWYFRNVEYVFNADGFLQGAALMGDLGEPQFFVPRSPYQALALDWMQYEDLIYILYESPEKIMPVFNAINDSYDALYEGIVGNGSVRILNFGENVDGRLLSPSLFEQIHLPFYEKRAAQLRKAGIFTTMHLDGSLRAILPYLAELPVDGLEALTPTPQGDVTLEEIKAHVGDKILVDGIPALYFMNDFPMETLQECVKNIVDLFGPSLVLGISDELPMGAGPEALERLEWVRDYCFSRTGNLETNS